MSELRLLAIVVSCVALGAGSGYVAKELTNSVWQTKWDAHLKDDADATAAVESRQRFIEWSHAAELAKVSEHGQEIIDQMRADADADGKSRNGMRGEIATINARLVKSEASGNACITAASKAATQAAIVYSELFQLADDAAGIMAATADQAIERGNSCERSFQTISNK